MSDILSLSMRPRTLSALWGQDALVASIRQHVAKRPPRAWMLTGGSGNGKTTIARILSVAYQCTHMPEGKWGDPCAECWKQRANFAIHEINASSVNGIEELTKVAELARYRPSVGIKRVIILDEAHRISSASSNMLLKPLEEPAEATVWIVCTTEPQKILATLRRRLVTYTLKSFSISQAEKFLTRVAERAEVKRPLAPLFEQLHLAGIAAPALLLQALEKYAAGASASEAAAGGDAASVETLRVCKAVTSGDWKTVAANLKDATADDVRWVRASVAGWLKGILAREANPRLREQAATSLLELCAMPVYDESILLPWLWAALEKISRRYSR
jgi:hypothetical protein